MLGMVSPFTACIHPAWISCSSVCLLLTLLLLPKLLLDSCCCHLSSPHTTSPPPLPVHPFTAVTGLRQNESKIFLSKKKKILFESRSNIFFALDLPKEMQGNNLKDIFIPFRKYYCFVLCIPSSRITQSKMLWVFFNYFFKIVFLFNTWL